MGVDLKLTDENKRRLSLLKRRTGIKTFNVLCRWALCVSIESPKPLVEDSGKTTWTIKWPVFCGDFEGVIGSLLAQETRDQTIESPSAILRSHVSRGLRMLSDIQSLEDLLSLVCDEIDT